ncbi:DER1 domain containing protein [Pyrenophora tritici-repentis]|nr:DER1 domain containing protein [Pyrenophora tritici-repentis]
MYARWHDLINPAELGKFNVHLSFCTADTSNFNGTAIEDMVRQHGSLEKDEETNQAAWEAARGALIGGTKWGAFFAVAGGVAYAFSPLYRGLTIQFRTTITALAVALSAAGYGGITSLYHYIFASDYVFTTRMFPQLWRIFTAFLITKPKFAILLDPYLLYQYGSSIERESSRFSQPGDFFVYTLFVGSVIAATAGGILNAYTFLPALSLAYAYTFAQDNPTRSVSFFIVTFESKYLPFAMLFMTFVIDGPEAAATQLTGLVAAHLYDFLTRIWPTFGGGTNYIRTPDMVKRWFAARPGSVQSRGFGHVVEGRGRAAGAPGSNMPSTGRTTGASTTWGGMGPGRRLGD